MLINQALEGLLTRYLGKRLTMELEFLCTVSSRVEFKNLGMRPAWVDEDGFECHECSSDDEACDHGEFSLKDLPIIERVLIFEVETPGGPRQVKFTEFLVATADMPDEIYRALKAELLS